MIGLLSGTIRYKKAPHLIIECCGVGYEVEATMTAFTQLPDVDKAATIYTHLSIREDAHVLFGFVDLPERDLFRLLIKVNGIGPKMAIAILSGMTPSELATVVATEDTQSLTRLPGIGKKTAERLLIELKDKLKHPALAPLTTHASGKANPSSAATIATSTAQSDAIDALVQLGYKATEAERMVTAVDTHEQDSGQLIRLALQNKMRR